MDEICTIKLRKDTLRDLNLEMNVDYELKEVDVRGFDYSKYPEWVEQKKLSTKAYMKLKEIEYKIRHK